VKTVSLDAVIVLLFGVVVGFLSCLGSQWAKRFLERRGLDR